MDTVPGRAPLLAWRNSATTSRDITAIVGFPEASGDPSLSRRERSRFGSLRSHNWVATMPPSALSIQVRQFSSSCYICVEVARTARLHQGGRVAGFGGPAAIIGAGPFGVSTVARMRASILHPERFVSSFADSDRAPHCATVL